MSVYSRTNEHSHKQTTHTRENISNGTPVHYILLHLVIICYKTVASCWLKQKTFIKLHNKCQKCIYLSVYDK